MYTIVGVVTNTHGIKGALKVYPYTFDNNRFNEYGEVYIGEEKLLVHIKEVSFYKNLVILSFDEFNDINEVLKYKEAKLYIKTENRKVLEGDNYYLGDLLGCKVYDDENKLIGQLVDIIQGASNDVYVIKGEKLSGSIPAVKEYIKDVDIENKKITIKPIKGMFDEN